MSEATRVIHSCSEKLLDFRAALACESPGWPGPGRKSHRAAREVALRPAAMTKVGRREISLL
jgi:hypothetical protein